MNKALLASLSCILFLTPLRAEDDSVALGKATYLMQCARCHGMEGKGDGPDAKRLTIYPRDLTSGVFKFKSTVYGTPPTDDDVVDGIIGHGLGGSGMPSFSNLSKPVRQNLLAYIKTISPAFKTNQAPQPIADPSNLRAKPDLEKGKQVYNTLQCALCHGANGRANGTSAFTLKDKWERPIKVANLTHGWTYRGGSRPIDIYHRILAGIEGAPMPSYEGAASHEDIWQLCNYVASLQLKGNWSGEINAVKVSNALPLKVDDPIWAKAQRTDINLQNYFYENGRRSAFTIGAVSVQALYNDTSVVFRIFWDDPVMDDKNLVDTLLVALKPKGFAGDVRGNLYTLYEPDAPVLDLTLWQASNPKTMGQKKTTLSSVARGAWAANQILESSASYEDGRWTLVFSRPLNLDPDDVLVPGRETRYISFAAWDGHNGETGPKRSVSQWIRLNLGRVQEAHK